MDNKEETTYRRAIERRAWRKSERISEKYNESKG
jgi:hypothetical protein